MLNRFPDKEVEGKITLYPEDGTIPDLQAMVMECVDALCKKTVSISEMMVIINNPVHRFGGERKFRVQGEESITFELGDKLVTYPVWCAIFKSSGIGNIGENEVKIYLASDLPPQELGMGFITAEGTPDYIGYYLKTKMGHDMTTKSGRVFHICVDKCIIPWISTSPLYQIEIEYKYSPDDKEGETLEEIQAEIDEIIHELSSKINIPHEIGGPKKGKWLSESVRSEIPI